MRPLRKPTGPGKPAPEGVEPIDVEAQVIAKIDESIAKCQNNIVQWNHTIQTTRQLVDNELPTQTKQKWKLYLTEVVLGLLFGVMMWVTVMNKMRYHLDMAGWSLVICTLIRTLILYEDYYYTKRSIDLHQAHIAELLVRIQWEHDVIDKLRIYKHDTARPRLTMAKSNLASRYRSNHDWSYNYCISKHGSSYIRIP